MRSWDDLYADREFHWEGAETAVVAIAAEWRERGITLIHDLGCGAGRNMGFLQGEGFTVIGSDVSPRGLAACAMQLGRAGLSHMLVQADMGSLPFRDGAFDATISINVLNHGSRAVLQAAADAIHRTLRPGGEVLLTVLNTWDWRFGSGEEPEPHSWMLADGPEAGILHHFFDEPDLREWLGAFEIVRLERERGLQKRSTAPGNRPVHRDQWQVLARK